MTQSFESYVNKLRSALGSIMPIHSTHETHKTARSKVALLARYIGRTSASAALDIARHHEEITSKWLTDTQIRNHETGDFDASNLLCWLAIAEQAGVPAIPATVIAELTENEVANTLSATLAKEKNYRTLQHFAIPGLTTDGDPEIKAKAEEKLTEAMDRVPSDHMVRYERIGAGTLKAFAGAGIAGPQNPEFRDMHNMTNGTGWVARGNRRMITLDDSRIRHSIMNAPDHPTYRFVSRPWIAASRFSNLTNDHHRNNTPLSGPGSWPAEWRAIVQKGKVVGVTAYYSWAFEQQDETFAAIVALAVRNQAQKIMDTAIRLGLRPAHYGMDSVYDVAETAPMGKEAFLEMNAEWMEKSPPNEWNATLDFIETETGPVLLEGNGPVCPLGHKDGSHPIGFMANLTGPLTNFTMPDCTGVVLSTPPDLDMTNLDSGIATDPSAIIRSWEDIATLAGIKPNL